MSYNLIECNREQMYLMPVSLGEWLPEGHLAWFILDAVGAIDLSILPRRTNTGEMVGGVPPMTLR